MFLTLKFIENKASCPYIKKNDIKHVNNLYGMPIEHQQWTYRIFFYYYFYKILKIFNENTIYFSTAPSTLINKGVDYPCLIFNLSNKKMNMYFTMKIYTIIRHDPQMYTNSCTNIVVDELGHILQFDWRYRHHFHSITHVIDIY